MGSSVTKQWFWFSLSDPTRERGKEFVGCIIIDAASENEAAIEATASPAIPDRELDFQTGIVPIDRGPPPPGFERRLLDRAEAEILAFRWWGGRLFTPEEIKAALMDDEAKPGDLIKGRG
jgi:hypothetical protein